MIEAEYFDISALKLYWELNQYKLPSIFFCIIILKKYQCISDNKYA